MDEVPIAKANADRANITKALTISLNHDATTFFRR